MSGSWRLTALPSATIFRFRGLLAEGQIGAERIIALKPQTYMNNSGESVQPTLAFFKLPVDAITVFYDELDLTPGKVRVKRGGGAAGHNGLRSMDRMLGGPDYWRVRIGIGHPGVKERVLGHVLGNFSKQDEDWLPSLLDGLADAAPLLVAGQPEAFMSKVALSTQ
jgi:PTH1 family peptidyl-tRNA hydrolase